MSRLLDRLRQGNQQPQQTDDQYLPDDKSYSSELAREYEKNQKRAQQEYKKQLRMAEATNPHKLYTDMVTKPSPPKQYQMTIMGRPIDVNALEQYLIFKISPKTITTLMRYNDSKSIEEIRGYARRPQIKASKGIGLLILIGIVAMLMIGVGYLFLNGTIPAMMRGMFGGFM